MTEQYEMAKDPVERPPYGIKHSTYRAAEDAVYTAFSGMYFEDAVAGDVGAEQMALATAGFYKGRIDGDAGPMTRAAVIAFQKAEGLNPDGKIGPKTWAKLEKYSTSGGVYSPQAVAGLMGHIRQESQFDPHVVQPGGNARSTLQFEPGSGGKLEYHENRMRQIGKTPEMETADDQLETYRLMVNSGDVVGKNVGRRIAYGMANAKTPQDSLDVNYEFFKPGKPHAENRKLFARDWENEYKRKQARTVAEMLTAKQMRGK